MQAPQRGGTSSSMAAAISRASSAISTQARARRGSFRTSGVPCSARELRRRGRPAPRRRPPRPAPRTAAWRARGTSRISLGRHLVASPTRWGRSPLPTKAIPRRRPGTPAWSSRPRRSGRGGTAARRPRASRPGRGTPDRGDPAAASPQLRATRETVQRGRRGAARPAPIDDACDDEARAIGLRVHRLLGLPGSAVRTSILADEAGDLHVLEVNTLPGMTRNQSLRPACGAAVTASATPGRPV